jgi:hypothetical protein
MRSKLVLLLLCGAIASGCTSRGYYRGSVAVSASTPDLAYVAPGVYVIANYDEPIFYADGYYWYPYDGIWYRSRTYTGGWTYSSPPVAVARIGTPYAYRYYRPNNYVVRSRPVPAYRIQRPVVRDHRDYRARPAPVRRR